MPISASPHTLNAPDVVAEDFDGQVVILNLANGHYFSLEGCAGDIWALITSGYSPDAILSSIQTAEPAIHDDSVAFLRKLIELGLVRPDDDAAENRQAISTAWPNDPPRLEVYNDLAELIYADPIHDVDEQAGWPKPRQDQ
jgi:hypothetical protein